MGFRASGFHIYGAAAGGGGGSVTYNQHTIADFFKGPTSYATGGVVVDLSKTYSTIHSFDWTVKTRGANLPASLYIYSLNTPSAGKVTVKIMRKRYDQVSSVGNINSGSQPTGVTIQASSGVASSNESTHTHSIDHDHGSFNSPTATLSGGQGLLDALGPLGMPNHTHAIDLPNFTGTSGAGTAHNHVDNSIYQHQHSLTYTETDYHTVELPNATNLSGTEWTLMATGVKL